MCELTFTNLHDPLLNRLYVIVQTRINGQKHSDGFGYFTPENGIVKTQIAGHLISNLGIYTDDIETAEPVISHVRKASLNNNVRTVAPEFSHPFLSKDGTLVLAHNGTLDLKDDKLNKSDVYKNKIDSQIFLDRLEMYYSTMEFVPAIQKTMTEFEGKFAFLIYSRKEEKFFIIRGESADLYKADLWTQEGEFLGTVVNTEEMDLQRAILEFNIFYQLCYKGELSYKKVKDSIAPLEKETIYVLNEKDALEKIGELKENKKPATYTTWQEHNHAGMYPGNYYNKNLNKGLTINSTFEKLWEFMQKYKVDRNYLDELLNHTVGYPLLYCRKGDVDYFLETIVPTFENQIVNGNFIKEWEKIINSKNYVTTMGFHRRFKEVSFPYFLETDIRKLRDARKELNETKNS